MRDMVGEIGKMMRMDGMMTWDSGIMVAMA
jgi:hypothetical protein